MTLRHIVTWKLSGATRAERDAQAAEITAALEPLREAIPEVRELSLHRNELFDAEDGGTNWDLTLVADFDDADGLAVYASHPDHLAAVGIVQGHAVGRVATDFTL